ncbi:MAG TPA: 2Fe-2S iron-sulfur cluster-binding protein [Stellaceae bacterium]|jgi:ferredoxin|nr:2Fe-2S iron-sulfur cluster-binding protein [Stellaceae bacterium]
MRDVTAATIGLVVEIAGLTRRVEASVGETLMVALKRAGAPILAVCGGRASCGTCLVTVGADWVPRLPPQSRLELNLLGAINEGEENDRLACQITLMPEHDGLEIHTLD